MTSTDENQEHSLIKEQEKSLLRKALEGISENCRDLLALRYDQALSYKQIADILNVKEVTLRSNCSDAWLRFPRVTRNWRSGRWVTGVVRRKKMSPKDGIKLSSFAYIERDMDNSARGELEAHLKSCEICASEVESIRKMDVLLKHHSDIFHPDEQQLYRYVTAREDAGWRNRKHMWKTCENCQEDVAAS